MLSSCIQTLSAKSSSRNDARLPPPRSRDLPQKDPNSLLITSSKTLDWLTSAAKNLTIPETKMLGLMAWREEFGPTKPLKGERIVDSLHSSAFLCDRSS